MIEGLDAICPVSAFLPIPALTAANPVVLPAPIDPDAGEGEGHATAARSTGVRFATRSEEPIDAMQRPSGAPIVIELADPRDRTASPAEARRASDLDPIGGGVPSVLIVMPSRFDPTDGPIVRPAPPGPIAPAQPTPTSPVPEGRTAPSDPDGIRPMALTASDPDSVGELSGLGTLGMMAASGGSDGDPGGDDPDLDPHISGGWGDISGATEVPVGAIMEFHVIPPDGKEIESVSWDNGTGYSAYFNSNPEDLPPDEMSVVENVSKNGETYTFIVDASPRRYEISVEVTYTEQSGGGSGNSTYSFYSIRPQGYFSHAIMGQIWFRNRGVDPGGNDIVGFGFEDQGVWLEATTEISDFGGQFMFLQTSVLHRTFVYENNMGWVMSSDGQTYIDDGLFGVSNPLGMLVQETAGRKWILPDSDEENQTPNKLVRSMWDPVEAGTPSKNLSVAAFDSFSTYLMYLPRPLTGDPQPAVWIALARADWTFEGAVSSPWPEDKVIDDSPAPPAFSSPLYGGEFPAWSGKTSAIKFRPN